MSPVSPSSIASQPWAGGPALILRVSFQPRVPHPFDSAQGRLLRLLQGWAAMLPVYLIRYKSAAPHLHRHFRLPPFAKSAKDGAPTWW